MTLSPTELAVLAAVHRADEEEGGLATEELEDDERDVLSVLARRDLVELVYDADARTRGRDPTGSPYARVSWRGVEALRDAGFLR